MAHMGPQLCASCHVPSARLGRPSSHHAIRQAARLEEQRSGGPHVDLVASWVLLSAELGGGRSDFVLFFVLFIFPFWVFNKISHGRLSFIPAVCTEPPPRSCQ